MFLVKNIGYVLLYCLVYNGSAFKLFDANPLLSNSPLVNLSNADVELVVNVDVGGEYTTDLFTYNRDQNMGLYKDPAERCDADHIRCLTSILSSARPVCVISTDGKKVSGMASLCDAYLANCKLKKSFWTILDIGNCTNAKHVNIYGYPPNTMQIKGMPG